MITHPLTTSSPRFSPNAASNRFESAGRCRAIRLLWHGAGSEGFRAVWFIWHGAARRRGSAPLPRAFGSHGLLGSLGRAKPRGGSEGTEFPLSDEAKQVLGASESGVEGRSPSAAKQRAKANVWHKLLGAARAFDVLCGLFAGFVDERAQARDFGLDFGGTQRIGRVWWCSLARLKFVQQDFGFFDALGQLQRLQLVLSPLTDRG